MSNHPQRLGKYELQKRLGHGGMIEIWKALDTQLHRYVAVKLLHVDMQHDPAFMTRFVREARLIASLHHSNIVPIYDFQTTDPSESSNPLAYLVMEYVEGQTLAEYLRRTSRVGKFPAASDIVHLFASISRAIDFAHQHGIVHRDIKPSNILLDQRHPSKNPMGEPILTDFGIAKLIGGSTSTVTSTWPDTPLYTSPEQAQGYPGNERSDLYSLGVILYEICTGIQPFTGETVPAILMQHIQAQPTPPSLINPGIPPALTVVILRCLAKDPSARFSSASAITAAIAEAFILPIPEGMSQASSPKEALERPTFFTPQQPGAIESEAPSPQSVPNAPPKAATPVVSTPQVSSPSSPGSTRLAESPLPLASSPSTPSEASLSWLLPGAPSSPSPITPLPGLPGERRRGVRLAVIALVVLVLLSSGLGAFYWFTHPTPVVTPKQVAGNVFFLSSGQGNEQSSQGINDELQIDLQDLSPPAAGKALYAWLLSDKKVTEPTSILLTTLTVANGGLHVRYAGDAQHTNLLEYYSRFLLTEENASPTPIAPSLDQRTWRYYAELPQTVNPADNFSLLDHLRHLLAKDPTLESLNLPGGLDIWLVRNTQQVMTLAGNATSCWQRHDTMCINNNLIRILDYLDGSVYVQTDVPPGTPNLIDPRIAPVALLEFDPQNQKPPGYLFHINKHLRGVIQAPGKTTNEQQLATQISIALNNVTNWLEKVRQDAKQLIAMPMTQWLSQASLALLKHMEMQAGYGYDGQRNPNTNQIQEGVLQIHHDIQRLATFDVTPYTGQ